MSKPLVLYHGPHCMDGWTSAWVAWLKMGDEADYQPINYGESPPDVTGRDVVILDFSFKRPVLEKLVQVCHNMVLRDHHKTAQQDLEPVDAWPTSCDFLFDMTRSGARLAWDYFFPGKESPWLVDFAEDHDLWKHELIDSRAISAALYSYERSFVLWTAFAGKPGQKPPFDGDGFGKQPDPAVMSGGLAILRTQKRQVESICSGAREITIAGHRVLAANTPILQSEVAGKLAEGRPFGCAWSVRKDGKQSWSLRSAEDGADVSEIARKFGGGGHPHAAGFELTTTQVECLLYPT